MKKTNQKGITLVALIITIIVMLILVGVSVNVALSSGLFKAAQSGAKQTESERKAEEELSSGKITVGGKTYSSVEDYVAGKLEIPTDLQIGDYVTGYDPTPVYNNETNYKVLANLSGADTDQTFTEDESLGWRILSIDREAGKVELIADKATTMTLTLKGAKGWNNSEDILNNMCEAIYSMEGVGKARSVKVEDINTISGYTPTIGATYNANNYVGYDKFPIEYLKEKGITSFTASEISIGYASNSSIDVTNTYYSYTPESQSGYKGTTGLINLGKNYWLASRCVSADSGYALFDVRLMMSIGDMRVEFVFSSGDGSSAHSMAVRPVVSLESKVLLQLETQNYSEGRPSWKIVK